MKLDRSRLLLVPIVALAACLLTGLPADAARIVDIEFRGGGCIMQGGACGNASYQFGADWVDVLKDFSRVESEDHAEGGGCAGGHADGSSCSGQGGTGGGAGSGACAGQGGPGGEGGTGGGSGESGHTGGHESEAVYDRLPPIHMFLTLENTGQDDLYTFSEEIVNHTNQYWAGFLMALKQNEAGLAMFQHDGISSPVFPDVYPPDKQQSKKLQFTGGKYPPDNDGYPLTFAYDILFKDCVGDECIDAVSHWSESGTSGYTIMLQSFPLVPAPVPEPATVLLLGIGLISLTGVARRIKRS